MIYLFYSIKPAIYIHFNKLYNDFIETNQHYFNKLQCLFI